MECYSQARRLHGSVFHAVIVLATASACFVWPVGPVVWAETPHNARLTGSTASTAPEAPEFTLDDFGPVPDKPLNMPFDASAATRPPQEVPIQQLTAVPGIVGVRPVSSSQSGLEPAAANDRQILITAQLADLHIRRGFELGRRGALFSARSEFIQALRMLALAHDAAQGGNVHTNSLAAGMRALEEAEDFIPRGTRLEANIDLETVVVGHQTPALKSTLSGEIRSMSTQMALESYSSFARGHLSHAAGHVPAGSMALYGLGKVYAALGDTKSDERKLHEYRAMTLFQAALGSDANNPLAANELGVLMARYGHFETARDLLQRSVALQPQPTVWRNLAVVHQRMGLLAEAEQASRQSQISAQPADVGSPYTSLAAPSVNLVDPQSFAESGPSSLQETAVPAAEPNQPIANTVAPSAPLPQVYTPKPPIPYVVTPRAQIPSVVTPRVPNPNVVTPSAKSAPAPSRFRIGQ